MPRVEKGEVNQKHGLTTWTCDVHSDALQYVHSILSSSPTAGSSVTTLSLERLNDELLQLTVSMQSLERIFISA